MRDVNGPDSVDAIRQADGFLDALAGGRPVTPRDAADAELAALLGSWRDEMRWPPATGLITEAEAVAALEAGRAQKSAGPARSRWNTTAAPTSSRRNRRNLGAIGAAAAAVLCIGGFGALVAGAGPGDALYGLRTMMFGAPKQVRDAQVGLAARTELNKVQDLIEQGDWDQAQDKLVAVSSQVASIGDEEQKQDLLDQFNDLSAKVVERDPAATAAPGVVYTVPPSAAELVPAVAPPTSVPAAPPTSVPGAPTPSASATPTTTPTTTPTSPEVAPATSAEATPAKSPESAPASAETTGAGADDSVSSAPPSSASAAPQSEPTAPTPAPATSAAPPEVPVTTAQAPVETPPPPVAVTTTVVVPAPVG